MCFNKVWTLCAVVSLVELSVAAKLAYGAEKTFLTTYQPASTVIGQAMFTQKDPLNSYSTGFLPAGNPAALGSILLLTDERYNRVIGFDNIPLLNNAIADFVIGDVGLGTSPEANRQGGDSFRQFKSPGSVGVAEDGTFYIADTGNNRIMLWNNLPIHSQAQATYVFGEAGEGRCDGSHFNGPADVQIVGTKLIVADTGNHRVLIWTDWFTGNNKPADIVIGQEDANHCEPGLLASPTGIWSNGSKLYIVDQAKNHVLAWNNFPTGNSNPDFVLGKEGETGLQTMQNPRAVTSNGSQFFVSDTGNHRVLIWNSLPSQSNDLPSAVLGQANFVNHQANRDMKSGSISARTLASPAGLYADAYCLIVGDRDNNRYLIYNAPAAMVLPDVALASQSKVVKQNYGLFGAPDSDTKFLDQAIDPHEQAFYAVGESYDINNGPHGIIAKYSFGGELLWHRTLGSEIESSINSSISRIAVDKDGFVYLGGYSLSEEAQSYFQVLIKLAPNNQVVWIKQTAAENPVVMGMVVDQYRLFIMGKTSAHGLTVFAYDPKDGKAELSSGGEAMQRTLTDNGWANDLTMDRNGNLIAAGSAPEYLVESGFTGVEPKPPHDAFIFKLDRDLNLMWIRQTGSWGNANCYGNGVATDDDGNSYLLGAASAGGFLRDANYRWTHYEGGFLEKYDANGKKEWSTLLRFTNQNADWIDAYTVKWDDVHGSVIVAGTYGEKINNQTERGNFVAAYDSHGREVWVQRFQGGWDNSNANVPPMRSALYADGGKVQFFLTGFTSEPFDSNMALTGSVDGLWLQFSTP